MDVFGGAPRFLAYPRPVVVQSGTEAVLKCQIGGDPRPAVIWERNNEKIDPHGRYRVFEDGNVYNLIITSVTVEDSGQYICKAKNSIGETYAAATLKVEGEAQEMELREENKPRFLIKPLSTRAGRGEDAVFSCKIWGSPKPDVVWEKDGKKLNEIFESTHFSIGSQDGGWFQLKIFKTRAPDGGVYTCKARNEFGEALAGAVLLVDAGPGHEEEGNRNGYTNGQWKTTPGKPHTGRLAPNRLKEDTLTKTAKVKMFAVTEGKHAKFRCFVTGKPKPEIIWRKDGRLILSGRRYLLYEDREGYFTLKVLYCKQKDNGVYVCAASNTAGQTLSAVHLSVKEPPVRFKQPLIDLEVWERDLAVLECEVPEDSVPITWYLEDRRLQPGAKYGMEQWGTKRRLTIRDIGVDDDGIYLCEMPDGGRSIAEVAVKGTILRKLPRKVDVLEGENAAFCVEVEKEEMDIHWYKDGVELRETHQTILKSFGRTHILVFVNTMPQDSGQVMFFVGRSKTSSQLRVKAARHCPPSAPVGVQINTERANAALLSWVPAQDSRKNPPSGYVLERQEVGTGSQEWLQCLTTDSATSVEILGDSVPCEADYRFRICSVNKYGKSNNVEFPRTVHLVPVARIQAPLQDALVPEGQDAVFSIELTASVIGTWFLNGTQVQEDDRFSTRRTRTHQSLRIRGVRDTDNGAEITFIAYGIRDSAALYIQAPLVKFSPLSEMDRNKFVEIGNPIVLYCELSDPAAPVHWYKNGEELNTTEGLHIQSEGTMRRIVIQSAEFSHSGVYCCDAIDDVIRFNVEVEAPPVRFSAIPDPDRTKRVHCGWPLLLQCEVSDASAQVYWYKDGSKLHCQSGLDILSEGLLRTLMVHSAQMYHSGLYSCKTKGDSVAFTVDVTASPVTFSALCDEKLIRAVTVGCPVELVCAVSDPEACVRWFHEDNELSLSSGVEIRAEENTRALFIQSTEMCHSGLYTCATEDDTIQFHVNIQAVPTTAVIERVRSFEAVRPLELEYEVPDSALSICWFKDDFPQKQWDKSYEETKTLTVSSAERVHSGQYSSESGDDTGDTKAPSPPLSPAAEVLKTQMVEASCSLGKGVILEGDVGAPEQSHTESMTEPGVSRALVIEPTHPSNSGSYYCATADDVALVVKNQVSPVTFLPEAEKSKPTEGPSPIVQQFEISDPIAKACWYKDGTRIFPKTETSRGSQSEPHSQSSPVQSVSLAANRALAANKTLACESRQADPHVDDTEQCQCAEAETDDSPLNTVDVKATPAWVTEEVCPEEVNCLSTKHGEDFTERRAKTHTEHSRTSAAPHSVSETMASGSVEEEVEMTFEKQTESISDAQTKKRPLKSIGETTATEQRTHIPSESTTEPVLLEQLQDLSETLSEHAQISVCGDLVHALVQQSDKYINAYNTTLTEEQGEDFIYFTQHTDTPEDFRDPGSELRLQSSCKPSVMSPQQSASPEAVWSKLLQHMPTPEALPKDICGTVKTMKADLPLEPETSGQGYSRVSEMSHLEHLTNTTCSQSEEPHTSQCTEPCDLHSAVLSAADVLNTQTDACVDQCKSIVQTVSETAAGSWNKQSKRWSKSDLQSDTDSKSEESKGFSKRRVQTEELSVSWTEDSQTLSLKELQLERHTDISQNTTVRSEPVTVEETLPKLSYHLQCVAGPHITTHLEKDESLEFSSKINDVNHGPQCGLPQTTAYTQSPADLQSLCSSLDLSPTVAPQSQTQCVEKTIVTAEYCQKHTQTNDPQNTFPERSLPDDCRDSEEFYFSKTFEGRCTDSVTANKVSDEALPVTVSAVGEAQRTVDAGEAIVLQCEVSDPKASVTWSKDGIQLSECEAVQIQSERTQRTLSIHPATPSHCGHYTCLYHDQAVHFHVDVKAPLLKFTALSEAEQRQTVVQGCPMALQCELSDAAGEVTWYKDGSQLLAEDGVDIQTEGHMRTVFVPSTERAHSGVYRCESKDDDVHFTVDIQDVEPTVRAVTFLKLEDSERRQQVSEGSPVVLRCQLSQDTPATVDWSKDGHKLHSYKNIQIKSDGLVQTLTIQSCEQLHSGIYQCSAADEQVQFEVDVKGRPPHILPFALSEKYKMVSVGSPIMLQCQVSDPTAQVSWAKDEVELFCKTGLDMKRDGCLRKLMLHSAKLCDSGVYRCSLADDWVAFMVDVQAPPVSFSPLPEETRNKSVEAGRPILMQCEVSEPSAQVYWQKDGEDLQPLSEYEIESTDRLRALLIKAAQMRHSGVYSCDAKGDRVIFKVDVAAVPEAGGIRPEQSQICHSLSQTVQFTDDQKHQNNSPISETQCHSGRTTVMEPSNSSFSHPKISKISKDSGPYVQAPPLTFTEIPDEDLVKSVVEAEELVLACEVSVMEGLVQWYKDGSEIQPNDSLHIQAEGTTRRLIITATKLTDTGTYSCRAGDNVLMFKVTVREPPVMIIYPKEDVHLDRHVPEEIILSCELSRSNGPVTWFKDGQKLQESENIKLKVEGPYRRLKIQSSRVEDSGEYVCDTEDDSIFFHLSITEPPVRIVSPSQSQMELCQQTSERMVLSCELSRGNAVVRWYRDGLEVEESEHLILEVDGVYRRLIIPKTTLTDSAEYVCDTADDSMTFFVNIAEPPVRFVRPRKMAGRVDRVVGESVVLDCEVSRSNAEVTWKRNAEEVEESKNISIIEDGVSRQLTIHCLSLEDAGQYVCDAKDDVMDFTVTVKEPPVRIIGKTEGKAEKQFLVSDDIVLVCELSRESAEVRWFKGSEEVEGSERVCCEEQGVFRSLVVLNAGLEDSGEYTCDAGDDKMVFYITVTEPPVKIVGNSGVPEQHLLLAGEDLILECEVSRPDARVQWLRNGETLEANERIEINSFDVVRKFVLSNLQPSDSGEYTCDATDDKMIMIVEVQEPPATFLSPVSDTTVSGLESDSLTLTAVLTSDKANVRWLRHGHLLDQDNIHISSSGPTQHLTLNPLQLTDAGQYMCDVQTDQITFNVVVKEMKVKFTRALEVTVAQKGASVTLQCEVNKAKGDVQWLKDGQEVALSSRRYSVRAQGRERSLTIHEVIEEDEGEYSCESTDDKTSATVTVEIPRVVEFMAELRNITVREGEDAVFKCVVSPEDAELLWRLNHHPVAPNDRTTVTKNGTCHTLCLHRCTVSDSGTVTADAEGVRSEAELQVQEEQAVFTSQMQAVSAEEYSEASLEVEVSLDTAEVQWMRGGILLHPGPKYTLLHQGLKHSLTVHRLDLADSGRYSCETLHDRSQAQLTVTPRKISIKKGLCDVRTTERETASFEVELSHPYLTGAWFRNGVQIKPGAHFRLSSKDRVHSLTICNLNVDDTGTFMFTVENLRTSARLVVKEPPVTIFKKLEDQKFPEGAIISIECELSRHNVDVKWMKDGVEVKPSKDLRIYAMGRKRFLQVMKCGVTDAGVYSCDVGDTKTCCSVQVYERELLMLQELEDVEIVEDQNAVFMCEVSVEDVQAEWFKRGEKIQPTSTIKIRQEGTKHFLLMCNVRPEDSGEIKFVARHVESVAFLDVEELPLNIVNPLQDKTVLEKTRVLMDCTVSNPRCSIRWYKGSNVILPSERFEICSEGCIRKLVIQQVALEDEGMYSVQVGEFSCSAKLTVEAQSVVLVRELADVEVTAPQEACFEAEVSVPVQIAPLWTLNGEVLQPSSRVLLEKMGTLHRLTFRQTTPQMSGEVGFSAGRSQSRAWLTVMSDPSL